MLNGEYVVAEQVQHELLESSETTYNFEVEDYHTYFVGENSVLVHNKCKVETGSANDYSIHDTRNGAFRAAKQEAGIPMSEQPIKVVPSVDRMGKTIPGRTYVFKGGKQIMQHSVGHAFENGIKSTRHFNIFGSAKHFFY